MWADYGRKNGRKYRKSTFFENFSFDVHLLYHDTEELTRTWIRQQVFPTRCFQTSYCAWTIIKTYQFSSFFLSPACDHADYCSCFEEAAAEVPCCCFEYGDCFATVAVLALQHQVQTRHLRFPRNGPWTCTRPTVYRLYNILRGTDSVVVSFHDACRHTSTSESFWSSEWISTVKCSFQCLEPTLPCVETFWSLYYWAAGSANWAPWRGFSQPHQTWSCSVRIGRPLSSSKDSVSFVSSDFWRLYGKLQTVLVYFRPQFWSSKLLQPLQAILCRYRISDFFVYFHLKLQDLKKSPF